MFCAAYISWMFCLMHVKLIYSGEISSTKKGEIECSPGYVGPNCSIPCRYPSFGQDCQLKCSCEESDCHGVTGCKGVSTLYPIPPPVVKNPSTSSTTDNETNLCNLDCQRGYTGARCDLLCRFPSYGDGCQMNCSCTEKYCNHTHGCSTNITNIPTGLATDTIKTSSVKMFGIAVTTCYGCTYFRDNIYESNSRTVLLQSIKVLGGLVSIIYIIYVCTFFLTPCMRSENPQNETIVIEINSDPVYENEHI
ncbi:cell death abnormality protein 1-like isoform X2 [Ostrea edulis]|uniref:cell death abnormality protein 1-like isoform X2 n=1 Tax=Ostrea edulis TaxID=37623 RepID=UPI0024AFE11B|nr:cell death abnormality protein 1-like isoform X2 [Ostrea edulis]